MRIRQARPDDAPAIAEIYNHAIENTMAAWLEEPVTAAERREWIETHNAIVAEDEGQLMGFAGFAQYRAFPGYRYTVENSVFVSPSFHGRGVASALMRELIDAARAQNRKVMIACIEAGNSASIALHEKLGFRRVDLLPGVGYKSGSFLDLAILQLDL